MMRKLIFFIVLLAGIAGSSAVSAQKTRRIYADTVSIPFGVKQSGVVHKYTLEVLDSVVAILKTNNAITLSIEGYSYIDEGNDTVCKYLSLNRALFIRDAIMGRGLDTSRISSIKAMGQFKPEKRGKYKVNLSMPYRVEVLMIYPPPPKMVEVSDRDFDGVIDEEDECPDVFGYEENKGCPPKDRVLLFFDNNQSYMTSASFLKLDKLLALLKANSTYTISISGHASKDEGIKTVTDKLSVERSSIVLGYLSSRNIGAPRIDAVNNYGKTRPVNGQRNPQEVADNSSVEIIVNKHD